MTKTLFEAYKHEVSVQKGLYFLPFIYNRNQEECWEQRRQKTQDLSKEHQGSKRPIPSVPLQVPVYR